MIDLTKTPNWCLSGGASGADLEWGMCAAKRGHGVTHFSFEGAKTSANRAHLYVLSEEQLAAADVHCHRANLSLRRKFPAKSLHTTNLLRRDWYQVYPAQSFYGVSTLQLKHNERITAGEIVQGEVKGGTAWATQMFIDKHDGVACPCYLFDQFAGYWFKWEGVGWLRINEPPRPEGAWTGVGSRDLLPLGTLAIRVLMDYRQNYHSQEYPPY